MLFETLAYHPGMAPSGNRMSDFGYSGHFFAEYSYRLTDVVSVGFQADIEGIYFTETPCDVYRKPVGDGVRISDNFLSLIPTVQFTYFDKGLVELYSGLGVGLLLAMDSTPAVEPAPVLYLNLLAVSIGKDHWRGALELGGLNALLNANKIYMLGSRLVSVSVNYRW